MNLKECRERAKLRQKDVAIALQIDRSTVAKWETGESLPRADKLPQLAKILDCTVDDLFRADEKTE